MRRRRSCRQSQKPRRDRDEPERRYTADNAGDKGNQRQRKDQQEDLPLA